MRRALLFSAAALGVAALLVWPREEAKAFTSLFAVIDPGYQSHDAGGSATVAATAYDGYPVPVPVAAGTPVRFVLKTDLNAYIRDLGTLNTGADGRATLTFTDLGPNTTRDELVFVMLDRDGDGRIEGPGDELAKALVHWVARTVVEVGIDIKPGSTPNPLNVNSHGDLPVAVLGASIDVTKIDPSTVSLQGVAPLRSAYEDVDGDGALDLSLKFDVPSVVQALANGLGRPLRDGEVVRVRLTANLLPRYGRDAIQGADDVVVRSK